MARVFFFFGRLSLSGVRDRASTSSFRAATRRRSEKSVRRNRSQGPRGSNRVTTKRDARSCYGTMRIVERETVLAVWRLFGRSKFTRKRSASSSEDRSFSRRKDKGRSYLRQRYFPWESKRKPMSRTLTRTGADGFVTKITDAEKTARKSLENLRFLPCQASKRNKLGSDFFTILTTFSYVSVYLSGFRDRQIFQ